MMELTTSLMGIFNSVVILLLINLGNHMKELDKKKIEIMMKKLELELDMEYGDK